ncbi:MAG: HlyC/CorC family transporter [Ectothiorhodospiraceae bacterium]|nr:HlyC/CorC family transporter [Ectothiorhodospiraceae bacterium]
MADVPLSILFLALLLLLLCSAFFSGTETALMALNRYRMQHMADAGHRGAILARRLLAKPDRLIGVILLGNNLVNILATQLATYIGYRIHGDVGIAIATGTLTLVLLIFAEVAPKTFGALHSERIAYPASYVYVPLLFVAYPLVWLINLFANSVLRLLGMQAEDISRQPLSTEELRTVVSETSGLLPNKHQRMLLNILDLERETVEDIMVPRGDIVGIDLEEDWDEILRQLVNSAYTRMPVYTGSIDHALGFVHLRKIMPLLYNDELTPENLRESLLDPYFIPEGTPLMRQLVNFQRERRRISLVVDEYGDIQGLVTLEDLLEEIVGEFTTDPSEIAPELTPQEDGSYLVDGGMHLRDLNRALGCNFGLDGPRTLNGLILEHLETMPEPNSSVLIAGYPIDIVQVKNNMVKTARIGAPLPNRDDGNEGSS